MNEVAGQYQDIGDHTRIPPLYDLDARKKIIDNHKDYAPIMADRGRRSNGWPRARSRSTSSAASSTMASPNPAKNRKYFPGWIAQVSLDAPDAGVAEAEPPSQMGALGVQIYTNAAGKPIDRAAISAVLEKDERTRQTNLAASGAGAETPDYLDEKKSLYEIWWTFGWSLETATAMIRARLLQAD